MTTFVGLYATDQTAYVDPTQSASFVSARSYSGGDGTEARLSPSDLVVTETATPYPGPVSTDNFDGWSTRSFFNDWYFRIHIIPGDINLGNLVSDQSRDVYLWNAYLASQDFEAFATTGENGISITQPDGISPPYTIPALGLIRYDTTILVSGPPTIDSTITWTVGGVEYDLSIIGRRVIAFPFPPNWANGVNETLEFRSTIIPAQNGSVQTASIRRKARRIFDYTVQLKAAEAQRADSLIFGWQHRFYAMPVWPEESFLLTSAAAGTDVLSLDTSDRSYAVGGLITIFASPARFEVREIASIDENIVTLTSPLEFTWPTGAACYPAFVSAINPGLNGNRLTDGVLEIPVRFTAEPSSTPDVDAGTADATYRGYELVLYRPNWISGLSVSWNSDADLLDLGGPRFSLAGRSGFSEVRRGHNWTLKGYAEVAAFRRFLKRRGGVGVPFFMPSGLIDFTMVEPALASDTAINVAQNDYERTVDGHPAHRDIIIQFRDGTYLIKRISSSEVSVGGLTRLVFTESLGQDIVPDTIKRISYLALYRFASNEITLNWITRGVVTADATLVNNRT